MEARRPRPQRASFALERFHKQGYQPLDAEVPDPIWRDPNWRDIIGIQIHSADRYLTKHYTLPAPPKSKADSVPQGVDSISSAAMDFNLGSRFPSRSTPAESRRRRPSSPLPFPPKRHRRDVSPRDSQRARGHDSSRDSRSRKDYGFTGYGWRHADHIAPPMCGSMGMDMGIYSFPIHPLYGFGGYPPPFLALNPYMAPPAPYLPDPIIGPPPPEFYE
jgi:hypothetical protein